MSWRASKLAGVAVYGPYDKKVGSISDVLMNHDGTAGYVVVGVGGFLGIGQKDVAVPFDKVKFTDRPVQTEAPDAAGTGGPAVAPRTAAVPSPGGAIAPNTTVGVGVPAGGSGGASSTAVVGASSTPEDASMAATRSTSYPDHGTIDLTADQLKAAPSFQFAK